MQQATCPGCGAPVQFKSAASVMAVCEYCKTTLLKDAASVVDLGKMSDVLEDYSPLQIGTAGRFDGRSFALIGRIQLRYSAGFWNEWYVLFDDGGNGWLSDASGQFTVTFAKPMAAGAPLFQKLVPGRALTIDGRLYTASDVRTARCVAGQGELPFKVAEGWEARVADFRAGDSFLSLDYSDADSPRMYVGRSAEQTDLALQLLRDLDQLHDAAGRFRGKIAALACPSCGSPVKSVPGVTTHIVCPSCCAVVDTTGAVAAVLAAGEAVDRVHLTLALGSEATIDGGRFTVLGAMRRADTEGGQWTEYLLYAPGRKFKWLIETDGGWQQAEVLDRWPTFDGQRQATLDQVHYSQSTAYEAKVIFAAGSFNWRVSVGDSAHVTEYIQGRLRLSAEATTEELTWARSSVLPTDQLRAWFGMRIHDGNAPRLLYTETARRLLIALLAVNAIPLFLAMGNCLPYVLFACAAIYLPAYFLDKLDQGGS